MEVEILIKANEEMKENAGRTSVIAMQFMYLELGYAHVFADGELLGIEEEFCK